MSMISNDASCFKHRPHASKVTEKQSNKNKESIVELEPVRYYGSAVKQFVSSSQELDSREEAHQRAIERVCE